MTFISQIFASLYKYDKIKVFNLLSSIICILRKKKKEEGEEEHGEEV